MERRELLRQWLAKAGGERVQKVEAKEESVKIQKSTFFTEGSADLLRAKILQYSIPLAAGRIAKARRKRENPDEDEEESKMVL